MNALSCVAFSGDTSRITAMAKDVFSMQSVSLFLWLSLIQVISMLIFISEC